MHIFFSYCFPPLSSPLLCFLSLLLSSPSSPPYLLFPPLLIFPSLVFLLLSLFLSLSSLFFFPFPVSPSTPLICLHLPSPSLPPLTLLCAVHLPLLRRRRVRSWCPISGRFSRFWWLPSESTRPRTCSCCMMPLAHWPTQLEATSTSR